MPLNITSSPAVRDVARKHGKQQTKEAMSASQTLGALRAGTGSGSNGTPSTGGWTKNRPASADSGNSNESKKETSGTMHRSPTAKSQMCELEDKIGRLRSADNKTAQQEMEEKLNIGIGCVIMLNAVVIALETDLKPDDEDATMEDKVIWILLESVFCIIFGLEIAIRVRWHGLAFFKSIPNALDAGLVGIMIVETWILKFISDDMRSLGLLSVLRLMRVVRLVRLLRIVKVCRGFYAMACAFWQAAKSMVWLCMMMMVGLFLFSLFTTSFIGKSEDLRDVDMGGWTGYQRFGTVFRSMYSLFELMTLEGWPNVGRPIITRQPGMFIFLFVFIMIFTFGLLNMIVAMVVEATITQAKKMEELSEQEKSVKFGEELEIMKEVFCLADDDGNGVLTLTEFTKMLDENEEVRTIFDRIQLPFDDISVLYSVLDCDDGGEMTIDEFIDGCQKIRCGQPTNYDIIAISAGVRNMRKNLVEVRDIVKGGRSPAGGKTPGGRNMAIEAVVNGIDPPDLSEYQGDHFVIGGAPLSPAHMVTGGRKGLRSAGEARPDSGELAAGTSISTSELLLRLDTQTAVQKQIFERLDQLSLGQLDVARRLDAIIAGGLCGSAGSAEESAVTTHADGPPTPLQTPRQRSASNELPGTINDSNL